MLKCVIVDDEALARERLKMLLTEIGGVQIAGEAGSGKEAVPLIHAQQPDVVFLDIQMPVLDGFDVVDLLAAPRPTIVFVTAYDEYAIRAFEVHAIDYITKPVRIERLRTCIERLNSIHETAEHAKKISALQAERASKPLQRLSIHVGRRLRVLNLEEIRRIESREKLVFVHIAEGAYPTDFTLDVLEQRLDGARFIRLHRSHIVNSVHIRELHVSETGKHLAILQDGVRLPIARRRMREVMEYFEGG